MKDLIEYVAKNLVESPDAVNVTDEKQRGRIVIRLEVGDDDYGRGPGGGSSASAGGESLCGCFDDGFRLAESNVGVMSAQYRTGFEYCRARLGEPGSCAFTAGWNAALSSRPFEATCRAAIRREGC